MKHLFIFVGLIFSIASLAQDVIVMKDGSTILAKITEVDGSNIKYKKWSYQDGPTFSVSTGELLSINYQNGDKQDFSKQNQLTPKDITIVSKEAQHRNLETIQAYNRNMPTFSDQRKKKSSLYYATFGIKSNSQILNDDIELSFITGAYRGGKYAKREEYERYQPVNSKFWDMISSNHISFEVRIKNLSDRTVYFDLGNSFVIRGKVATPYYIPQSNTTIESSTHGIGIVGGLLPVLPGALSLNASSTHGTSHTTFSQRVVSIPPHSYLDLDPQCIVTESDTIPNVLKMTYYGGINSYMNRLNISKLFLGKEQLRGMPLLLPDDNNELDFSVSFTYSYSEDFHSVSNIKTDFYLKQVIPGGEATGAKYRMNANELSPNWIETITFPCTDFR